MPSSFAGGPSRSVAPALGDECLRLHVDMDQKDRLRYRYSPHGSTPRSRAGFSSAIMSEAEPLGLLFSTSITCPEEEQD